MKLSNIFSRKNRILLRELVITDFKLRYQGSALGYAWSALKPLFLFTVLYIVFDRFLGLGKDVEHFPVYLLIGIVLWTFFTEGTMMGLQAIVSRGDLIRKINFPKYVIVISGTISALINLAINTVIVVIFCVINGVVLRPEALLVIPLILELYIIVLALAFLLSAMNVKFRDVGYLWEIFLQAAFYATPIIYPIQMVIGRLPGIEQLLLMNPVAQIIQDVRYVLVTQDSITLWSAVDGWKIIIPFTLVVAVAVTGGLYFRKSQKYFAENV